MIQRYGAYVVSAGVIAWLAWYYFLFRGFPVNVGFTNAVIAFASMLILTLSFALGPVSRLPRLKRARIYRKHFGLIGFTLAALHTLLAAWAVIDQAGPIAFSDATSLVFAAVAFMLFALLAMTSTKSWVRVLGYANWKVLQRTGYIALVFMLIHVVLLGQGVYWTRTVGQIAITFVLAVLFVRALVLPLQVTEGRRRAARRRGLAAIRAARRASEIRPA